MEHVPYYIIKDWPLWSEKCMNCSLQIFLQIGRIRSQIRSRIWRQIWKNPDPSSLKCSANDRSQIRFQNTNDGIKCWSNWIRKKAQNVCHSTLRLALKHMNANALTREKKKMCNLYYRAYHKNCNWIFKRVQSFYYIICNYFIHITLHNIQPTYRWRGGELLPTAAQQPQPPVVLLHSAAQQQQPPVVLLHSAATAATTSRSAVALSSYNLQ